ncbi:uncharacterized protein K452DRAFT_135601 [Aplosporella prunicola CBS 121167]|uniref:Gfo/Idh/MocA-like oxidoreductase N-terminal domain-containing protein n=1 Tax=Aplosporella prunicola CBS 121167 TaxID=1176127 RepID=A0A6A6BND2_9PEZI|nr:uncharacterized protein K452DRAFT_135601 [Aplosporella prunicola CBS 121167]KAF2145178.1 hypothetical protein K452DRAFT_135601 [Aplosporella prunicola CBS 121167]
MACIPIAQPAPVIHIQLPTFLAERCLLLLRLHLSQLSVACSQPAASRYRDLSGLVLNLLLQHARIQSVITTTTSMHHPADAVSAPTPTGTTGTGAAHPSPSPSPSKPRILIIGAGSRGHAYAAAITASGHGVVAAVAEPIAFKRREFRALYMRDDDDSSASGSFTDWRAFVAWEQTRRTQAAAAPTGLPAPLGVDAAFVCVLDEQHREVIEGLAPLGLHVMCEKPLATTLADCVRIYDAMRAGGPEEQRVFGIGHVLRYSPHNALLRELVRERRVVGDVLSVEHTEPVGKSRVLCLCAWVLFGFLECPSLRAEIHCIAR